MSKALFSMMLATASFSASAIGVAGVAARGGIHRHCDDACLYRLDQAADRRASEAFEREAKIEAERAAHMRSRQMPPLGDPYTPPPPKPPGPHAEAMGRVNILRSKP